MNPEHPYRQRLNADFAGRVNICTKEMLLNGQNFSPDIVQEQLTVCILSYGSLRIDSKKKDVRKVYQENGNLLKFSENFGSHSALLADTPDTALIQVLRKLQPVVIVDESHNAGSNLSIEMLNNLNPSFILDLTATPRKNSNILSYVDARELKKENMVKLPVIVYKRNSKEMVLLDALQLQNRLEQQAVEQEKITGIYIRPIVLFQAQPKTSDDSETFEDIKQKLLNFGIPENQIAVKTSKVDDLGKIDLMSRNCEIRYIITVNALKEGWDCPFAYILATLANKTSTVDVEQILGRILRQPYTRRQNADALNNAYVLTCSDDFYATLDSIVKGLHNAGFTKKDYRISEVTQSELDAPPETETESAVFHQPETNSMQADEWDETSLEQLRQAYQNAVQSGSQRITSMLEQAQEQAKQYEEISAQDDYYYSEPEEKKKGYRIQEQYAEQIESLKLPQFMIKVKSGFTEAEWILLKREHLLKGFSLEGQDTDINFSLSTGEVFEVDIDVHDEAIPKYRRMSQEENRFLQDMLARMAPEEKTEKCIRDICGYIGRDKCLSDSEIQAYVRKIISNMTESELSAIETAYHNYAEKIKKKIESLKSAYRFNLFGKYLENGMITCSGNYQFPPFISPTSATDSLRKTLYKSESNDMNGLERKVADLISSTENIIWWHRNIERLGFCLNGAVNHYPDFIAMTESGNILMIETKGDDRDNSDSRAKLKLGQKWADLSGKQYRYFMVFDDNPIEGAYTVADFAEMLKNM